MRSWEVNGTGHQRMKHVLRAGMDADQLRKPTLPGGAWKWPAISADGSAATTYKGEIFVGDLLAIPKPGKPDGILYSDIPGLSEDGKALAWTLQNYGVYITDTAGGTPAIRYWAPEDNVAYNVTKINAMKADLQKIHQYLRRVKNNTPTTIGGGGSRPTGLWPLDEPTP